MKRIIGVKVVDGDIVMVESDCHKCKCINNLIYKYPLYATLVVQPYMATHKEWVKGDVYEFVIDQNEEKNITNPYSVYIGNESNHLTKDEFDKHFITIEDNRDNIIGEILNEL